jgi:protein tyrosine/serine phosphatase
MFTPMRHAVVVLLALAAACSGQQRRLLHPADPVTDFYQVSPGVYRGGRPDQAGVNALAKLGVKTIINLENDDAAIANETAWAKSANVTEMSFPMSGERTPSDKQVDAILAVMKDPARRPIYVHCMKGMDRTGIIVALHRVINEHWTDERAEQERDAIGFNHWLVLLDRYYDRKAHAAEIAYAKAAPAGAAPASAVPAARSSAVAAP